MSQENVDLTRNAFDAQELRDCGERVLALIAFEAQGRGGLSVRRQEGSVFDFRDGLAVRIES